jgi:ADP-L-glycero-D-manno-heptose 6-epimerase
MRIVITGGCGFIGMNLLKHLNNKMFFNIIVSDYVEFHSRLDGFRYAKITTPNKLKDEILELEKGDILIHLGANTSTVETEHGQIMNNNFNYSAGLFCRALSKGIRIIYASSAGVYGNGNSFKDTENIKEMKSLNPATWYARSKLYLDKWNIATGTRCLGLRFFNVWGDYEQHKGNMESIISKKYYEIKAGIPQKVYFHPTKTLSRDFIYVKDVVNIIAKFIYNDITGIYNVGTGVSLPWNELLTNYFEVVGNEAIIEPTEFPKDRESNYQFYTKADTTKLLSLDCMKDYQFYHIQDALKDFTHDRESRPKQIL